MTVSSSLYVVMPVVMVIAMGVWLGLIFRADSQAIKRHSRQAAARQQPAVAAGARLPELGTADLTSPAALADADRETGDHREPALH